MSWFAWNWDDEQKALFTFYQQSRRSGAARIRFCIVRSFSRIARFAAPAAKCATSCGFATTAKR